MSWQFAQPSISPNPHAALRYRARQTGVSMRSLIVGAIEQVYEQPKKGTRVTGPMITGKGKRARVSLLTKILITSYLPDVNVWIALCDLKHQHNETVWQWLDLQPEGTRLLFSPQSCQSRFIGVYRRASAANSDFRLPENASHL